MAKLNFNADEYYGALKQLLPKGPAWDALDDSTFFKKMLMLAALEFARIDADFQKLINESDPTTASVTLTDWFYQWGIPDECLKGQESDIEELRRELIIKIRTLGYTFAEMVPYIGNLCGYEASLDTADLFTVGSTVDQRIYDSSWASWYWSVTANVLNQEFFKTTGRVNERLSTWGDDIFECLIKHYAPAHTGVIFKYGE